MSKSAKEILDRIKAVFVGEVAPTKTVAPPAAPVVPTATQTPFKLKDGTDITIGIDDPTVSNVPDAGDMVMINNAPAAAGDYELEDGSTFTVDATGCITVFTPASPVTQPDFAAPPVPTLEERVAALEAKQNVTAPAAMSAQEDYKALFQSATEKLAKQDEAMKGIFELLEMIVGEPATDPVTLPESVKDGFAARKEASIRRKAEALKKVKGQKTY